MFDVKFKVALGGFPQKVHVRGSDASNPVLLFLHGGPGVPNRHSIMGRHSDLCDAFTVATWDQRGTGGSYWGVDAATLTLERLVEDARELVEYLCARYDQEKVFVCGGSWGTELGTLLAFRYPQHIAAYVGYGQVVNGEANERLSYEFSMNAAVAAGDDASVAALKRCGPPVKGQYRGGLKGLMAQRRVMTKYGGHSVKERGGLWATTVRPMLLSGEYSLGDVIGMARGYKLVLETMWPLITDYDFTTQCNRFEMPYYIFQGRQDNNTPAALVQGFYDAIIAPDKALVWFEHSAHGPLSEEPAKFKALLRQKLLGV